MVNCKGRDNVGGAFNGNLRDCNDISLVKKFPSLGSFQLICLLMKGIEYQVLQGVKEAPTTGLKCKTIVVWVLARLEFMTNITLWGKRKCFN